MGRLGWMLLSPRGRMGRRDYLIATVLLTVLVAAFSLIENARMVARARDPFGSSASSDFVLVGAFVLALFWSLITLYLKRLHDLDRGAAWLLLWFVPPLNFLGLLALLILRGTDGPNRFGAPPA